MKKITNVVITGVLFVGLALMAGQVEWVREAWAQAKTVMYRDWQQTVTVAHVYNNTTPNAPPLTVTGNSLGVPAIGFATDMVGNSTTAGLGALTGPDGQMRRLTDGSAQGAVVVKEGGVWTCAEGKAQKLRIVTCPPYNAKGDGVTDDSPAFMAAMGTGNANIVVPPGIYIVWNLIWQNNVKLTGSGVGVTTLKLPNNKTSGIIGNYRELPVHDIELSHMTFDGNGQNNTKPGYAPVGLNSATNFFFHHLVIKNGLEYCMGLEGGTIQGKVSDVAIGPCRWDGIDIKNGMNNTRVELVNISVDSPGSQMGANAPQANSVCVDSGGRNRLTNIRCTGLTGQTYGVNFRTHQLEGVNCEVPFCEGGDGSSLNNFYVQGDGTTTINGAGSLVRDGFVQISNGYIEGMGRGIFVESDPGTGESRDVMVSNVVVMNAGVASFATDSTAAFTSFVNCNSVSSKGVGANFQAGSVRFIGGSINNSASHGIQLGGTAQYIKIVGSTISQNTGYGVYIGLSIANTLVVANTIVGNGDDLSDGGTNSIIQNNHGVKTADNGIAVLPAGATSVVVTHGLEYAPESSGISLTAMGAPTTPVGMVYIDAASITPTTFTIRTQTAPGGTGLYIGWRAIVKYSG